MVDLNEAEHQETRIYHPLEVLTTPQPTTYHPRIDLFSYNESFEDSDLPTASLAMKNIFRPVNGILKSSVDLLQVGAGIWRTPHPFQNELSKTSFNNYLEVNSSA